MMFDVKESCKMSETEKVVTIIKEVQCWRLGNWDGCVCSNFSIRNVDIEISCGKSAAEQAVKISSRSMDYLEESALRPIADEVFAQVTEQANRSRPFKVIILSAKSEELYK